MAVDPEKIKALEKLPFEDCMARLEEIVQSMETGNVPLEKMISSFEEGSAIAELCHKKLNSLKQKIEILQKKETTAAPAPTSSKEDDSLFSR